MKTILFLVAACFAFASCQTNVKNEATAQAQKEVAVSDHVEVLYFHGNSAVLPAWPLKTIPRLQ